MPTPFNATITDGMPFNVPAGKLAEFRAFPVIATYTEKNPSLSIGAVTVAIVTHSMPVGPLFASAGDVISWSGANGAALSGVLTDVA